MAIREIPGRTKKKPDSLIATEKRETNPLQLGPQAEAEKKPLGTIGGGVVIWKGKKIVYWGKKMLVGKKKASDRASPGVTCDVGPLVETVTFVALAKVPGSYPAGTSIEVEEIKHNF